MDALKAILYYSIFKYPITRLEIFEYSNYSDLKDLDLHLSNLLEQGIVYEINGFYSDKNDINLINRRISGNKMAQQMMPKACKVSRLISNFPFVQCVCLSGGLSKGYYDEDSDMDFFIITKKNRLWIARTLLVLYKKIFLFNSKKHFCVNYFISSNNLKIEEQNIFTATEITSLIPIYGEQAYESFIKENQWAFNYYPNKKNNLFSVNHIKKTILSKYVELLLNPSIILYLERFLKKITFKIWQIKFKHLKKTEFDLAMKSTEDVSKHHPQNFQKKVINTLNEKFSLMEGKFNLQLKKEYA